MTHAAIVIPSRITLPRRLLAKAAHHHEGMYAHSAGYFLLDGRWHALPQNKPAPKGASVAAHPKAAGYFEPAKHFSDEQWGALKLPDSGTGAAAFNRQLQQVRELSEAGDVTGLLGMPLGNTSNGKRLSKIVNFLLNKHGSEHSVAPGQEAGTHTAVQAGPVEPHPSGLPEHLVPKAAAPQEVAPTPAQTSAPVLSASADMEIKPSAPTLVSHDHKFVGVPALKANATKLGLNEFLDKYCGELLPQHLELGINPAKVIHAMIPPDKLEPTEWDDWSDYEWMADSPIKIQKYAQALKNGLKPPPILVSGDEDGANVLDGHHRVAAYIKAGIASVPVVFENRNLIMIWAEARKLPISSKWLTESENSYLKDHLPKKAKTANKPASAPASAPTPGNPDLAVSYKNADGTYTINTFRGVSQAGNPNDHGAIGKGPYSTPFKRIAESYAGKNGKVSEQQVHLKNPLIIEYGALNKLQQKEVGAVVTGFDPALSQKWNDWMVDHGYDGAMAFDTEVSATQPQEVVALSAPPKAAQSAHADNNGNWVMPIKEAIAEHKDLVSAAESPGKADDKAELAEQKAELARMQAATGRAPKLAVQRSLFDQLPASDVPPYFDKLDSIPWGKMLLPDTNTNAGTNNRGVARIKALAYAGNLAALKNIKFGIGTYGKRRALLRDTVVAAIEQSAPKLAQVEQAAHEAATSPHNDTAHPTDAQVESGNYKKGHIKVAGLDVTIENPRGSVRSGTGEDGSKWSNTMAHHYGYLKRTTGADGQNVDVFVGPHVESDKVFVVDQLKGGKSDGGFDEHKVMLGFADQAEAVAAYRENYEPGWRVGPVTEMSAGEFKGWLKDGDTGKAVADTGPNEGERNAEGLVFRDGRWHREDEPAASAAPTVIEHTTAKGKTLRGVVRADLTKEQAQAIDAYTFKKDGGWFIREKYLQTAGMLDAAKDAGTITPEQHEVARTAAAEGGAAAAVAELKKKQQADKLRQVADSIGSKADAEMNRERVTNTARRARMAGGAIQQAEKDAQIAQTIRNLADAIESGQAQALAGIRSAADVRSLDDRLVQAAYQRDRSENLSYAQQQAQRGRAMDTKDVLHAKLPQLKWGAPAVPSDKAIELLKGKRGAKELIDKIRYSAGPTTEIIAGMKKHLGEKETEKALGWYAIAAGKTLARFERMGIKTDADLRSALMEYLEFRGGVKKEDPVKAAERALVGQKVGVDFFPTPKALASRMAEMAGIKPGMEVLEPSAGNGNLADAASAAGAKVEAVEVSDALRNVLAAKGHTLAGRDFEEFEPGKQYDAVLMNPPFSDRKDAAHIMRAWDMVKPGGTLVAIAGEGVFLGSDKKAVAFREWLDAHGATVEKLPEGTFQDKSLLATTGANARLVALEKPASAPVGGKHLEEVAYPTQAAVPKWAYADYSEMSRQLAQTNTRAELEAEVKKLDANRGKLADSHLSAIDRSTSMQSGSARRAATGTSLRGNYEKLNAYENALEIYDNYPEQTKEGGAGVAEGPQDGDVNADGLVFRDGRWHREGEENSSQSVKLKQGNVALVTPLKARKTDFGDYKVEYPTIPLGASIPAKYLTIKDGMVVGMHPQLAEKYGIKTVGEVQDKTDFTKQKEAEKAEEDRVAKEKSEREAKLIGGSLGIAAQIGSGKLSKEEGQQKIGDLKREYDASLAAAQQTDSTSTKPITNGSSGTNSITEPANLAKLREFIESKGGKAVVARAVAQSLKQDGGFDTAGLKSKTVALLDSLSEKTGLTRDSILTELGLSVKPKRAASAATVKNEPADESDPNSPDYRFADTGYIAGSRKEEAAASIKTKAKDGVQVRVTDVDWGEIEKNPREARELIRKSNLFGKVDWDALKADGMQPGAGFLVDRVYASVPQEPDRDSPQKRQDYALALESLRDRMERCKTPADVVAVLGEIREELSGSTLTAEQSAIYNGMMDEHRAARKVADDAKSVLDAYYSAMHAPASELSGAQYEQQKRVNRGWKPDPALAQRIEKLQAEVAAATEKYDAYREAHPELISQKRELPGGWTSYESDLEHEARAHSRAAEDYMKTVRQQNLLNNPTTRAWITLGDKFLGVLNYRSSRGSQAFAGHVSNARNGKISDWSWAEKEGATVKRATKREVSFQLKVVDNYERTGGRAVSVASTAKFKDQFGLRDVQSGNWVLNDPESAAWHVQQATEAFADLADLLGAKDEQVSMKGRLAMAFGARGRGNAGFGGAARAHYEPVHRVINLTKMGGGGTLAHEWAHALDNLCVEAEGGEAGVEAFASENPSLLPAGPLRDAFKAVRSAMLEGTVQGSQKLKYEGVDVRHADYNINRASPGVVAQKIKAAGNADAAVNAVDQHFGDTSKMTPRSKKMANDWRRIAVAYYGRNPEGGEVMVKAGPTMSAFAAGAKELDGSGSKTYWSATHEMFARAFQSYCEDKLADKGRRSDYLSALADNKHYVDPIMGIQWKPFPEGDERKRINAAFDGLVGALSASGTLAKAMALVG